MPSIINKINKKSSYNIDKIDPSLSKNIKKINRVLTRFITNIVVSGPAEVNENSMALYSCTAYFTDGSNEIVTTQCEWSENTIYASIDNTGQLTTNEVPNQDIPIIVTANFKGTSNSQPVSIKNVVQLTHITITGPTNVEERGGAQYSCTAYYDNGNDAPVTPVWSDNSAYGNIGTDGYLTTLETPNQDEPCTIHATYGGRSDDFAMTIKNVVVLNSIEIEGPIEVNEDDGAQYQCRAYYDDGTSPLVTPSWSDNSIYATINTSGYLTTLTVPQVDQPCSVTANFGGKIDSHNLTIKNVKVLDYITITGPSEVDEESSAEYTLTAYYLDDPSEVVNAQSWSEDSQYASINSSGQLTTAAVPQGDQAIIITANYGGKTDTHNVTIKNIKIITKLELTGSTNINERSTSQYTGTLYYEDDPSDNVTSSSYTTWSDDSQYASINSSGLLTTIDVQGLSRNCQVAAFYPGQVLRMTNQCGAYQINTDRVPIDTSKTYKLEAYLRVLSVDSVVGHNKYYLGLGMWDSGDIYLTERWGGVQNLQITSITPTSRIIHVSGTITGEGVAVNQFAPGTTQGALRFIANYLSTEDGTAICELLFAGLTELSNPDTFLNDNPAFSRGLDYWYNTGTYSIQQSDEGNTGAIDISINNTVDITKILISGAAEVDERGGAQYTATAYKDDGSTINITSSGSTTWREDSAYATMGLTGYVTTLETPNQDEPCNVRAIYPGKLLRCIDRIYFESSEFIPVTTGNQYHMEAGYRVLGADSARAYNRLYFGIRCYDASYAPLGAGNSYCLLNDLNAPVQSIANGVVSGIITGTGTGVNQFKVGTVYIRVISLCNYLCVEGNGAITDVLNLKFTTYADRSTPLNLNDNFYQDKLHWNEYDTNNPLINPGATIESDLQGEMGIKSITIKNVVLLDHITITGATEVDERSGSQYTCTAYYDDGSSEIVTSQCEWSDNSIYATINSSGYLTTLDVPNADQGCQITANYGGKGDTQNITIKNVVLLDHITITGATNVNERSGSQYTCTAYYDDGTNANVTSSTSWSENSIYATINSSGYLTTLEVPNADQACRITANYGGKSDIHDITIKNVVLLDHITITGATIVDERGGSQYTCTAYYDNGTNANVTSSTSWSENSIYATIGASTGYLTTLEVPNADQSCRITANYGGKSDIHDITIKNVVALDHITITGATEVDENSTAQYTNTAYYDDSSTANVTNSTTWGENSAYASISGTGLLTTLEVPSDQGAQITANYGGKGDTQNITIKNVVGIPAGLIVFYNDTVVPSGWERFSAPDNRLIVGAGVSHAVGDNGGDDVVSGYSKTTGTAGSHAYSVHPKANYYANTTTSGVGIKYFSPQSGGGHTHILSNFRYNPPKRSAMLIKSNTNQSMLPAETLIMGLQSFSGLTNVTTYNNKFITGDSIIADIVESKKLDTSSDGSHTHYPFTWYDYAPGSESFAWHWNDIVDHSSIDFVPSATITENLKKVLLSLWTKALSNFSTLSGMIAMYESLTPPEGWKLCDGTNDTPDLRDCFILPVGSGSENPTPQGNNTIDIGAFTLTQNWEHQHRKNIGQGIRGSALYGFIWNVSHNHGVTAQSEISWLPPYYALSFIMKSA